MQLTTKTLPEWNSYVLDQSGPDSTAILAEENDGEIFAKSTARLELVGGLIKIYNSDFLYSLPSDELSLLQLSLPSAQEDWLNINDIRERYCLALVPEEAKEIRDISAHIRAKLAAFDFEGAIRKSDPIHKTMHIFNPLAEIHADIRPDTEELFGMVSEKFGKDIMQQVAQRMELHIASIREGIWLGDAGFQDVPGMRQHRSIALPIYLQDEAKGL
jgi:hypothetical protein